MTPPLLSLAAAKMGLKVLDPAQDAEVEMYLGRASARVLDYLQEFGDPLWTADTAPELVQQMAALWLGHYWKHRGDDFNKVDDAERVVVAVMAELFARLRDPAFA